MTAALKSVLAEKWVPWVAPVIPTVIGIVVLYYGSIYFVTQKEFIPVQQAVAELTTHTNAALANQQVINTRLTHIQDALGELKTDIRELRTKK